MPTGKPRVAEARPVRVDLGPEDHRALRRLAADRDQSMAALVRGLILAEIGRAKKNPKS